MTTAAIDIDILDELFENQKKLDDVLNSFFDDDSFLASLDDDNVSETSPQKDSFTFQADKDFSLDSDDQFLDQESRSIFRIIVPLVVEVAAIYYSVTYFT